MNGETNLDTLLKSMQPELVETEYVFCCVDTTLINSLRLEPIATFKEHEGLTLVISKQTADAEGMQYDGAFKQITLTVHSSLNAVGLTAAVATKLAEKGLSANVIAAFYHDHIFVQTDVAEKALAALNEFTQ